MARDNIAPMYETAARYFVARNKSVSRGLVALLQRGEGGGHDLFLRCLALHPRFRVALVGIGVASFLQ